MIFFYLDVKRSFWSSKEFFRQKFARQYMIDYICTSRVLKMNWPIVE